MLRASGQLIPLLRASGALAPACQQALGISHQLADGAASQPALRHHQQLRFIGGDKIPEYWGKPSAYTEGTNFLGTPKDHMDLIKKRPLSPDVLDIDGRHPHYKFPWAALSSITNRATGVALSVGTFVAAWMSLRGSLDGTVHSLATTHPILLFPLKFAVCYTIFYHWLGGMRHFAWDYYKIGNQADKTSLLELPKVEKSSQGLFAVAAVLSAVAALM